MKIFILLIFSILTTSQCSLLEMSQTLWRHFIAEGLTKVGLLDPLRVPVIKVDQSEGDTSYRIVLRNVEIEGLNFSSLESVHIAQGMLKSNLSELEAGYVSIREMKDQDSIRYRFHTLEKEPSARNKSQKAQTKETGDQFVRTVTFRNSTRHAVVSRGEESVSQFSKGPEHSASEYKKHAQDDFQRDAVENQNVDLKSREEQNGDVYYKIEPNTSRSHSVNSIDNSSNVDIVYAEKYINVSEVNTRVSGHPMQSPDILVHQANDKGIQERKQGFVECSRAFGESKYFPNGDNYEKDSQHAEATRLGFVDYNHNGERKVSPYTGYQEEVISDDDAEVSASERFELEQKYVKTKDYVNNESSLKSPDNKNHRHQSADNFNQKNPAVYSTGHRRYVDTVPLKSPNSEHHHGQIADGFELNNPTICSKGKQCYQEIPKVRDPGLTQQVEESPENYTRDQLEKRPGDGYVDIVYADNIDKKIKHFGNLNANNDPYTTVYNLDGIMRGLHDNVRYIIHNFAEEESINKKNTVATASSNIERVKEMTRYAQRHQEEQGYFEQGMQLVYHFGGLNPDDSQSDTPETLEVNNTKRRKREHTENEAEDDVIHVILRLRVPLLQVKANYLLTGKVGEEVVRGNGLLAGNFTGLFGDFTIELKKVDENLMIVRAARARLVAEKHNVVLHGMNDKGPVESILVHGLMAAEAVAAMLADDLATKALNEKTADGSMVYKLYKNAPLG